MVEGHKMNEGRGTAFILSFLLHGIIVGAVVLTIPFSDAAREGPITIDLNFVTPDGKYTGDGNARPHSPARYGKKENKLLSRAPDTVKKNERDTLQEHNEKNEGTYVDTEPQGDVGSSGDPGAPSNISSASSGNASGGTKTLNYGRPGGADERHFSFIREAIMRGVIYPERARRMGWEGRVVLSFMVHENGSIYDVRIVASSGFSVLDENARKTVAKTNLRKPVPVRLYVLLPVEYKLQ